MNATLECFTLVPDYPLNPAVEITDAKFVFAQSSYRLNKRGELIKLEHPYYIFLDETRGLRQAKVFRCSEIEQIKVSIKKARRKRRVREFLIWLSVWFLVVLLTMTQNIGMGIGIGFLLIFIIPIIRYKYVGGVSERERILPVLRMVMAEQQLMRIAYPHGYVLDKQIEKHILKSVGIRLLSGVAGALADEKIINGIGVGVEALVENQLDKEAHHNIRFSTEIELSCDKVLSACDIEGINSKDGFVPASSVAMEALLNFKTILGDYYLESDPILLFYDAAIYPKGSKGIAIAAQGVYYITDYQCGYRPYSNIQHIYIRRGDVMFFGANGTGFMANVSPEGARAIKRLFKSATPKSESSDAAPAHLSAELM